MLPAPLYTATPVPSRRGLRWGLIAAAGLVGLAAVLGLDWVAGLFDRHWLLGTAGALSLGALFGGIGVWAVGEAAAIARLERATRWRADLDHARGLGDRPALHQRLTELAGELARHDAFAAPIARWRSDGSGRDAPPAEMIRIFEGTVLAPADRAARRAIRAAARDIFGLVAVSPTALTDTALFGARALRLVGAIATAYGHRPGRAATFVLARRVLADAGLLVATDLAGDALIGFLGGRLVDKISVAAGEGMIAAQRMARLGLLAMEHCRPVAFGPDARLGLADLLRAEDHPPR
jgi:putative membrane protein